MITAGQRGVAIEPINHRDPDKPHTGIVPVHSMSSQATKSWQPIGYGHALM